MPLDERLVVRFAHSALKPGTDEERILYEAGLGNKALEEAWSVIKELPIIYGTLEMIANANGTSPEDPRVAKAAIIGDKMLERDFNPQFVLEYMNKARPDVYRSHMDIPREFLKNPHHNTWVRTVGKISKPEAEDKELAGCLVVPGIMIGEEFASKYRAENLGIVTNPFEVNNKGNVAVHAGEIIAELSAEETFHLLDYGFPNRLTDL